MKNPKPNIAALDEALAVGAPPEVSLSKDSLDRIARLCLALTQAQITRSRVVFQPQEMVPYDARPEQARANMRAGVARVVQALILLGYIEP